MFQQRKTILLTIAAVAISAVPFLEAQTEAQIDSAIKGAYDKYKNLKEGKNADYIPALAKVNPNVFGIALVGTDGKTHTTGDIQTEVSIQSISKVFTMALVM